MVEPFGLIEPAYDYCVCGHHSDFHNYDEDSGDYTCNAYVDNSAGICTCQDYTDVNDPELYVNDWED